MASLWQKKSGIWCVTYWEKGKQRVRSLKTRDKREALRLKHAIESALDTSSNVALMVTADPATNQKNPTLDEFWEVFQKWAAANRAAQTRCEYRNWFQQIREFMRVRRLGDVTPRNVEEFKESLIAQGKKKPKGVGLCKQSVNNGLRALSAIWNQAIKQGLYTGENPFAQVERLRIPKRLDQDYLDEPQIAALLSAAKSYADDRYVRTVDARNVYLAVGLMALAGLRKREVCFSRWEWIDWARRLMLVSNDEHFTTKNKQPRVISLNAQLIELLMPYRHENGYILEATRQSDGKTPYRVDFKKGFRMVCAKAGIDATPHDLRHSFASRHAVAGTSLHVIAGWLGHSSTWVTQRYAHYQKTFNAAADNIM